MRAAFFVCLLVLVSVSAVQSQAVCPADVLLDFGRAASVCYRLEREVVCSGNGAVTATGFDGAALIAQPGDRASAAAAEMLTITSAPDELGVALLSLRASLPALSERSMTVVAFGDVTLMNRAAPLPQLTAVATGLASIRSRPQTNADIIGQAAVNNALILNGRTADGRWLRAQVRNADAYGWVAADVLNVQGSVQTLAVVAAQAVVQRAFEVMDVSISNTAFCEGALRGGLLFQTPGITEPVTFTLNGERLSLAGTAFVSGETALEVYVLQGFALAGDAERYTPAGAWTAPGLPAAPFDPAALAALPLHLLPVSVRLPAPITDADIVRMTADYEASQVVAETPAPLPTADPLICRRETRRATTLFAGPGRFYEAINEMRAGQRVEPVLQTTDPDGRVWWQLGSSNWILAVDVRQTGECADVPHAQVVPAPRENTLSLETCQTTNGPLRAGQRVTIQFTPPPWDNRGEARDAVIVDPGRISIGARTYRAQATEPIQIGTVGVDDRYLRRFYIVWTAEPGTHRIVGDRLSYEPICTLTVPVE
jgi:hypothetical protein